MAKVHTVFCYIPLYWLVTADVVVVFINPGLDRVTGLPSINLMPGRVLNMCEGNLLEVWTALCCGW